MKKSIKQYAAAAATILAVASLASMSPASANVAPDAAHRATVPTEVQPYIVATKKRVLLVANVYAESDITLHGSVRFKVVRHSNGKLAYSNVVDAASSDPSIPISQVIDVVSKKKIEKGIVYDVSMMFDARWGHLEKDSPTVTVQYSYN